MYVRLILINIIHEVWDMTDQRRPFVNPALGRRVLDRAKNKGRINTREQNKTKQNKTINTTHKTK
jgi:hypothetical protein